MTDVFIYVAIGFVASRIIGQRGEKAARWFINFALYALIPFYVFASMWTSPVSLFSAGNVVLTAAGVMAAGGLFTWVWTKRTGTPFRQRCMPVMFMNSAYLAIPVNTLLWGAAGTAYAIIYNMAVTIAHFTVGIYLVAHKEPLAEMFRVPIIYAVVAGMALNAFSVHPPASVSVLLSASSRAALAVMLIFVGYRLCLADSASMKDAAIGVALRMAGGAIVAAILVKLIGLSGPAAGVCVMTSAMPAAVNSYILAEQYDSDPSFAASAVFLGTVLSLAAIPPIAYIIA